MPRDPNALWVQMLKGNYFPQKSLMDATSTAKASWASSNIPKGADFLKKILWQVMDGEDIKLWQDKWISNYEEKKVSLT